MTVLVASALRGLWIATKFLSIYVLMYGKRPRIRLATIEDGGHMMLGHDEEVRRTMAQFLEMHGGGD